MAAAFLVLVFAAGAHGASFEDYHARVSQAVTVIQQLEAPGYYTDDPAQTDGVSRNAAARLRQLLPASESVLFSGQHIDVNNSWLHEALDRHARTNNRERRADLIRQTREELRALLQRLDELKSATHANDKDASKARLAEILRRPEFHKINKEKSALERLWEAIKRWLAKLFPEIKPIQPSAGRGLSQIAQVVVIGFSVLLIAFLIWKFLPRYLRGRGTKKKKGKREARIVLGERLEPDQTASDLLEQAEALARAGDLRGAIRKAYIALLCELGDRKVISLAQHKTNRDYLTSVRNRRSIYDPLRKLTNSFELHWYGFVPPAAGDWEEFLLACRQALRTHASGVPSAG